MLPWLFAAGVCCSTIAAADVPFTRATIDSSFYQYADCKSVGDIDGDGLPDVIIGGGTQMNWYRYPSWTKTSIATANIEFTTDMQVGDVDGDGDLDIIVPDGNTGNNVLWFENPRPGGNPASGGWTRRTVGAVSGYCHDLAVGDFNGDGRLDILGRAQYAASAIFFQNTPTSWTKVTLTTAADGEGTTVADIDRDGDLDVVQNGYWLQNPRPGGNPLTGSAWTKRTINSNWPVDVGVATGDMNNDGRLDVVLAHAESTGRMVWYEAPADAINGSWIEHLIDASVDYAHTFKTADIDRDGQLDVVFAEMAQSSRKRVGVFFNGGNGLSWQLQVVSTSGSHNIRVADFGNDGDIDIVGANWQGSPIEWWQNMGGAPSDTTRPTITSVTAVNATTVQALFSEPVTTASAQAAGNYSINNGVSISGALLGSDTRTVTLTTSTLGGGGGASLDFWTYKQVTAAHTRTFSLCFPDVDGDGDLDIASGRYVYRNPGSPMTGTWTQIALPGSAHAFATLNVDGDNLGDLIAQQDNVSGGRIDIYWIEAANATATSWSAPILIGNVPRGNEPEGFQGYAIAQVVAGGLPEVIVNSPQGLYYFAVPASNPGGGNWPRTLIASNNSEEGIGVADIDNDGDLDISFSSGGVNEVKWARNPGNGTGSWSVFVIGTFSEADWPDRCAAADLNGDGRVDIIVTEENASGSPDALVCWWEQPASGPTSGNWVRRTIATQYTMNSMDVGDVDKDGDIDIVLAEHRGTKRTAVWENNGQGVFTQKSVDQGREGHLGGRLADLDADGDLDIVSIAYDTFNELHLWRNDSPAGSGGTYTLTVNNVSDRATPPNPIMPSSQTSFTFTPSGDTTRPTITSVTAVNGSSVQVLFSEPVTTTTSQTLGNYSINNGVTISGAVLGADTRTVTLTTSMLAGGSYMLTVNNVTDRATPANTIVANSQAGFSFTPSDTTRPTITSVTAVNANSVQVLFSEPVTSASAQTTGNYSINNGVTDSAAVLGADTRTVTLTTSTLSGGSYMLTVNNIADRATPPNTIVANSQTAFSFTPSADTTPPTTPGNLTGTGTSANTVQLAWQASSDNVGVTEYRVSRNGTLIATLPGTQTSFQDPGLTATTTYAYSVVARDAAGNSSTAATVSATTQTGGGSTAVVRVNAGGGAFLDTAGNSWSADFGFNSGNIYSGSAPISGTANDTLYQSERWSSSGLTYSFNLPNGNYTANLHFAEIWDGAFAVGGRVFDVSVEGQLSIDNLDIFSRVGANTALIISVPVTLTDGQLNIAFASVIQNPKISAIEVLGQTAGDTTRPTITSVTAVNANSVQVLFSEPVTTASAQTSANYGLNNGVTVSSAVLGADTRTVTLTTSTLAGGSYTLTANNVADRATPPNTIVANSQASFSFTPSDTTRPTITSVTAMNATSVQVLFSEPVTTATSQALGNYSLNNAVTISAAALGADTRTVTLTTSTLAGGSYALTVNNVADRATTANIIVATSQASFSFNPFNPRVTTDLVALYGFNEGAGTIIRDLSGSGTPLDLNILDPARIQWVGGGVNGIRFVSGGSAVRSPGAASKIHTALTTTSRLTLEAWITPANLTQDDPVRIVTVSGGTTSGDVNVHLGQGAGSGSYRLRTTANSFSWMQAGSVFTSTANPVHVVVTHDGSAQRLYLNGVQHATAQSLSGNFSNWNPAYPLVLGNESTLDRSWLGTIHLVAFYNRALSLAEIQQNRNAGPSLGASASALATTDAATSPYGKWRQTHFTSADLADPTLSGATSDPDVDQINNLVEYALGLDPQVANVQGRPAARLEDGLLVLTYSRNIEATDVDLGVEAATVLAGPWSSAGLTQQVVGDGSVIQTIKVTDSVAVSTTESRFLRLKVQFRQPF